MLVNIDRGKKNSSGDNLKSLKYGDGKVQGMFKSINVPSEDTIFFPNKNKSILRRTQNVAICRFKTR